MGHEAEAQRRSEGHHLGGEHRLGAGAAGQHDAGVVDHAAHAGPAHEQRRLQQEVLGLQPREARVVADEQPPRARQRQRRALRSQRLAGDHHAVRRGVVLHLFAGAEVVTPGALGRLAQVGLAHPARERAVGRHLAVFVLEDLRHAHGVALRAGIHVLQPLLQCRVQRRGARRRWHYLAQDAPHRVTRDVQQPADLVQRVALRLQGPHAVAHLDGRHR
jgi:hypothetical protein